MTKKHGVPDTEQKFDKNAEAECGVTPINMVCTAEPIANAPKWVSETPHRLEKYLLAMNNYGEGEYCQSIELDRDEYIELKAHLARVRGLVPTSK